MNLSILAGRRLHWLIASIALAMLGYLGFSLWGGWHAVLAAFAAVGLSGILIALVLSLVNYCLRFVRWQLYLSALGHVVAPLPSGMIYVAGFALTTTPGKAGEMLRGVFLRQHGMSYSHSTAAFLSERLSDLIAIVLLAMLGLSLYPLGKGLVLIGIVAVIFGLILLTRAHYLLPWAEQFSNRTDHLTVVGHHLLRLLAEARNCHSPTLLLLATFLSLMAWTAEAYAFHQILNWMGMDVTIPFAFSVYALSMLAGALSFLPGGLGGAEAVMVGLLLWAGMPEAQAIAATVIIRLVTLWFAVALGVGVLAIGGTRLGNTKAAGAEL